MPTMSIALAAKSNKYGATHSTDNNESHNNKYGIDDWGNTKNNNHETDEIGLCGDPICVRTLSSHCSGPFKCISIQHGVLVTSCRWYSAPHPFTKLILIVHIFVSS
ncbi:hypothetical protein NP493_673g01031 [Ridgeia piscesae]|uniref:Uncharacterized protein n=1 Tax=Ridgeia piscesae TaxID=27915 RepID=A0AAD9KT54_RIDPI|nr:hypothetical protein NP493_673g01031 [Ridgeia piscesae]